jgi:hypothetical protein
MVVKVSHPFRMARLCRVVDMAAYKGVTARSNGAPYESGCDTQGAKEGYLPRRVVLKSIDFIQRSGTTVRGAVGVSWR